jgi:hypothetical protein
MKTQTIQVTNNDFSKECILGFFWNTNENNIGVGCAGNPVFGMLTAVKHDVTYEESYGKRWKYFEPATKKEVLERCYFKGE